MFPYYLHASDSQHMPGRGRLRERASLPAWVPEADTWVLSGEAFATCMWLDHLPVGMCLWFS